MFSHIFIPLDTSPFAEAALPYARAMAEQFGAKITLITIVEMPLYLANEFNASLQVETEVYERVVQEAQLYLKGMAGVLRQQGYAVATKLVKGGSVAEKIVEAAVLAEADTIVMSTHGRSGVGRWLLGSVADRVLRLSSVPIVLIRAGHTEQSALRETTHK